MEDKGLILDEVRPYDRLGGDGSETEGINLQEVGEPQNPNLEPPETDPDVEDPNIEEDPEEGNSEEEVEIEEEFEVEMTGDSLTHFVEFFKSNKFLPEDYELPEGATQQDIDKAVLDYKEEYYKQIVTPKVEAKLARFGYNKQQAQINEMMHYGVTEQELSDLDYFQRIGSIDFDKEADDYDDTILNLGIEYHISKNETEEQAKKYAELDIDSEGTEAAQEKYQKYFTSKAKGIKSSVDRKVSDGRSAEEKSKAESINRIKTFLKNRKVGDTEYTEDQMKIVSNWMFNKTETVEIEGQKFVVTPLEKKELELQDFEKALKAKIDFILSFNMDDIARSNQFKGKKSLVEGLNKTLIKKRKVIKEIEEADHTSKLKLLDVRPKQ